MWSWWLCCTRRWSAPGAPGTGPPSVGPGAASETAVPGAAARAPTLSYGPSPLVSAARWSKTCCHHAMQTDI